MVHFSFYRYTKSVRLILPLILIAMISAEDLPGAERLVTTRYQLNGIEKRSMLGMLTVMHDSACIIHLAAPDYDFSNISGVAEFYYKASSETDFSRTGTFQRIDDGIQFSTKKGIVVTARNTQIDSLLHSDNWLSPYMKGDRQSIAQLRKRIVGKFGDYRSSAKKGHKHAGVDLKGRFGEAVYPISNGVVVFRSKKRLSATVVVLHKLDNGDTIYSKYVHLKAIKVAIGDYVTVDTELARIFNKLEHKQSRYKHPHVHLEIRKTYEDGGAASSYSMTMDTLRKYCFDPVTFLEEHFFSDE